MRAGGGNALGARGCDGGRDDFQVFGAEQAVLAGVGVKAADGDARLVEAQEAHGVATQLDGAQDALLV